MAGQSFWSGIGGWTISNDDGISNKEPIVNFNITMNLRCEDQAFMTFIVMVPHCVVQVNAPGMQSSLLLPLPGEGSESTQLSDAASSSTSHVQVRICADNVCSLQVRFVSNPDQTLDSD